jgi:hypothetical protein
LARKSYLDFAAYQIAAASGRKDPVKIKSELESLIGMWKAFLGLGELRLEHRSIAYELTALTPILRLKSGTLRSMGPDLVPLALTALYLHMILFTAGRDRPRTLETYESVLEDLPLGLIYLTEGDLALAPKPDLVRRAFLQKLKDLHGGRYEAKGQKPRA